MKTRTVRVATYAGLSLFVLGWVWLLFHVSVLLISKYAKWRGWVA